MSSPKKPSLFLRMYLFPFHLYFSPFHFRGRNVHSLLLDRLPTAKTGSGSLYPQHFWKLFLSIITIFSSSVFSSQLIIPFGQKISKIFFLIFWSCTFLKLCFLSVLSNSFNRFYLFHASYLLCKTIYSMASASPLFHLKRKGGINTPVFHSTSTVQGKYFPQIPRVAPG